MWNWNICYSACRRRRIAAHEVFIAGLGICAAVGAIVYASGVGA